jgi:hypothetical protein
VPLLFLLALAASPPVETAALLPTREAEACQVTTVALRSIIPEHGWRLGQAAPTGREVWRMRLKMRFPADGHDGWSRLDPQTGGYVKADAPSEAMIGAAVAAMPTNGAQCQRVRDFAATHDALGPETPEDRTLVKGLFKRAYVGIETAILSPDGDEAIVFYGRGLGLLNGSSHYLYFRKDADGAWRQVATLLVSVS